MNSIKKIEHDKNTFTIKYFDSSLKLNSFSDNTNIYVDITSFNLIKAIQVAILTSTYCFLNEFEKNICWLVKDIETKRALSILCLKNTKCKIHEKLQIREIA